MEVSTTVKILNIEPTYEFETKKAKGYKVMAMQEGKGSVFFLFYSLKQTLPTVGEEMDIIGTVFAYNTKNSKDPILAIRVTE